MITKFNDFLNENKEDRREENRKRIERLLNKARSSSPFEKPSEQQKQTPFEKPSEQQKQTPFKKPSEQQKQTPKLELKPPKIEGLEDIRLIDAVSGLVAMKYDRGEVIKFLKNIKTLYRETTVEDIIKFAIEKNCKSY